MGRLSDHLLAHAGPTAEFWPFESLRQYAPLKVMGTKVFLTSRMRLHCLGGGAGLDWTWHACCTLAGEKSPSGGVHSFLF